MEPGDIPDRWCEALEARNGGAWIEEYAELLEEQIRYIESL